MLLASLLSWRQTSGETFRLAHGMFFCRTVAWKYRLCGTQRAESALQWPGSAPPATRPRSLQKPLLPARRRGVEHRHPPKPSYTKRSCLPQINPGALIGLPRLREDYVDQASGKASKKERTAGSNLRQNHARRRPLVRLFHAPPKMAAAAMALLLVANFDAIGDICCWMVDTNGADQQGS